MSRTPRRRSGAEKPASRAGQSHVGKSVVAKPQGAAAGARPAARAAVTVRLPRVPKGRRPQFFAEPGVDQLFGIVTALTAELSAACERLETMERLLERRGALLRAEIETYSPDNAEAAERTAAREALIERVFQVLEDYSEPDLPTTD